MKTLFKILLIFSLCISACSNKSKKIKIQEVTLVELPEYRALVDFWKDFSIKFDLLDTAYVRKISLDSIWLWGEHISCNKFIKRYYSGYSSTDFSGILDTNRIRYSSIGCHPNPPIKEAIKKQYGDAFECRQVTIIRDTIGSIVKGIEFTFLETTRGYRLWGINYDSYYWRMDNSIIDTITIAE
jgi:hypothetical protein